MLRISIHEYGGRAHQRGSGGDSDGRRRSAAGFNQGDEAIKHGPVIVHVVGKEPVTPLGRDLLKAFEHATMMRDVKESEPAGSNAMTA